MMSRQGRRRSNEGSDNRKVTLGDMLNEEMVEQLKHAKKNLSKQEKERKEAAEEQKRQERREREKNKSFEQLLSESELDWKKFK